MLSKWSIMGFKNGFVTSRNFLSQSEKDSCNDQLQTNKIILLGAKDTAVTTFC